MKANVHLSVLVNSIFNYHESDNIKKRTNIQQVIFQFCSIFTHGTYPLSTAIRKCASAIGWEV